MIYRILNWLRETFVMLVHGVWLPAGLVACYNWELGGARWITATAALVCVSALLRTSRDVDVAARDKARLDYLGGGGRDRIDTAMRNGLEVSVHVE